MIRRAELPPPVAPGDPVGVAALSGVVDPRRLRRGMTALAALGFEPVPAANLRRREGIFAGSDAERLDGFHRLAADPALPAIFFARGGHGALRLLPALDWPLLARRPRAYVGYSDLTPFLLQVVARLGLVAFHGPMVAADLARGLLPAERRSLLRALGGRAARPLALQPAAGADGVAEGPLLGGCLSLVAACAGTPYAVDLEGSLLFWEDVAEPFYRLDRLLTQLELSGSLAAIRGMVVGRFDLADGRRGAVQLTRRLRSLAGSRGVLAARGLPSGHRPPNLTLPLGAIARLTVAGRTGRLEISGGTP